MSLHPKHLIRYGLILLGTAAAVGCSPEDGGVTDPGSISLSLSETSATVEQGGSQQVTATLTRIGGFTGAVNLTVTGAGSGVTANVSNVQTSGSVTTATVTIFAGVAAVPAVYPLVVHGTGSGVGEVTQGFTLTVPASLGFSISLSAAALSIVQGASTPTTTVNITRGINTGSVGLYVTGLPTGVTDSFDPASWPVGNSTILTLTVGAAAVPGSYNLQVNAYDAEQHGEVSAPLTLTVTAPPPAPGYTLSLSAPTLSIAQGAATPTTTVNIVRNDFAGPVELAVGWDGEDHDVLPPGVTAAFAPTPATGNTSVLTLTVGAAATPGVYFLFVFGGASTGGFCCIPLTLTVTATPSPAPGYTLSLSPSALSVEQGGVSPVASVDLARTNFTGNVGLSVDNLPAGVKAQFRPENVPLPGSPPALWLYVAGTTLPGTYTNLLVRGVALGLSDRTALLTLTITVAPFILTLSSDSLRIVQGGSTPTTTVNVVRHNLTGPVTLYVDEDFHLGPMPPGMTAAFGPNPATGNSSVLTISVGAAAVPGVYELYVYGHASTGWSNAIPLTLTVLAASP